MRNSYWFKFGLAALAIAVVFSWIGIAFDDEDLTGAPDFQPMIVGDVQALPTPLEFFGYKFCETVRPCLSSNLAHYLKMHEKSPPSPHFIF